MGENPVTAEVSRERTVRQVVKILVHKGEINVGSRRFELFELVLK